MRGVATRIDSPAIQASLKRTEGRARARALLLVSPLLAFLLLTFLTPIGLMLVRSVYDPTISEILSRTSIALSEWRAESGPPKSEAFAAFADDLKMALEQQRHGQLAARLNSEQSGYRSLVLRTVRQIARLDRPATSEDFAAIDPEWSQIKIWSVIKRLSRPVNATSLLGALDLRYDALGDIVQVDENVRIHAKIFVRTLILACVITGLCLLLGYPLAYWLASLPSRTSNLLLILVLLPFWTSLLVRTTAWIVILQKNGVLIQTLVGIGLIDAENRPQLIYNAIGTVVAMTHIMLPFMVLPLYSTMRSIPSNLMRASGSLGAGPIRAFWTIYVPLSLPGVGAGGVLVFIMTLGYYITPALLGGQSGQMISSIIAFHMQTTLNWGLASALGAILMVGVALLYLVYARLVGAETIVLGSGGGDVDKPPTLGPSASLVDRIGFYGLRGYGACVLLFLILPILVIIPLSFNAESFFTFTPGMLALDPAAFSLKWYDRFLSDPAWRMAFRNSAIVALASTALSLALGTIASVGLARLSPRLRGVLMAIVISPMIVPVIISGAGIYLFFSWIGLTNGIVGLILSHAALGVPFVAISVTAALSSFDPALLRAAAMSGASPLVAFRTVVLPIIAPSMISGGLFSLAASFDEIVVALFIAPDPAHFTVPRLLWSGIRQEVTPTILAVATSLIAIAITLLTATEWLRRRGARRA